MIHLFTKTYPKDYAWTKLAIKSVLKKCKEGIHWTFVVDSDPAEFEKVVFQAMQETGLPLVYKIHDLNPHWPDAVQIKNGYLAQQWIKMNAHRTMENKLFWYWDSDVIAVKDFTSQDFLGKSGRPIYWFSQFNHLINGGNVEVHNARRQVMAEIMDLREISFEWMRCFPIPMFGQILKVASGRQEWSRSLNKLIGGDNRFSEFNIIGEFCHQFFPDAFEYRNADSNGPTFGTGWTGDGFQPHGITCQSWSHGGIPECIQQYVDKM